MIDTIFIMPNKSTDPDATLMIVVDEVTPETNPKTYQYIYVGNINDLPSDVLTEESIVNIPGTATDSVMSQKGTTDLVSEYNVSTNNNNTEYTFSQAVALVPASLQKGGLTIKYIDSTTHEYAIKHLTSSTWNTTESNWNSDNMFGSGQVVNEVLITPNIVPNNDTKKIADARQINNLLDFVRVESKNLLYGTWITGKYYNADGSIGNGAVYKRMVIPCEPNTAYYYSAGSSNIGSESVHVVLFSNADGTGFESDAGACNTQGLLITTGANTKSIGVSASTSVTELQLELGTSRTAYEEPFEPYNMGKIKESILPDMVIPDGSITTEKFEEGTIIDEFILDSEAGKIADARQINNLLNFEEHTSKNLLYLAEWDNTDKWYDDRYFKSDGTIASGSAYKCTLIPCESNTDYYLSVGSGTIGASTSVCIVLFGEGKLNDFIQSIGNIKVSSLSIYTTNDSKYIGVSVGKDSDNPQLELGTSRTTYEEPFEPYNTAKIKESILPATDGLVGNTTSDKIADARQINKIFNIENHISKNLLYLGNWVISHYLKNDGTVGNGSNYRYMIIPCELSSTYFLSTSSGNIGSSSVYICLYGENGYGDFISPAVSNTERSSIQISTTSETHFIGISASNTAIELQLEVGTSRTQYEEPFTPYQTREIKENLLPPVNIPDGSITAEKLADGISLPASPKMFSRIYANNNTLAESTLLVTDFVECYKNISIVAHIKSEFTEIQVGLSYHGFYGGSFKIDDTNIILVSGESDTVRTTLTHGLILGNDTTFIIDKGVGATAKITLINDQGDMYQHDISSFGSYQGRVFLRNNGNSSIDAELSFYPKDINQKIWMFGDSYFSYSSDNRWTYYLISNGYTSNLIISRGGDSATNALNSLNTLLGTGARPSYILWFMGMNDGNDTSNAPNATWLEKTQAMLALCSEYSITPVLVTIPSVPKNGGKLHVYMNQWIKNSGYRYIDCAAAVEEENTLYWKNWGTSKAMLSSDEEHPTSYGAKALYARVIVDFPEITIED